MWRSVRALVDNASITDDAIGFHAQQAMDELDRNASLRSAEQALAWARGVLADGE